MKSVCFFFAGVATLVMSLAACGPIPTSLPTQTALSTQAPSQTQTSTLTLTPVPNTPTPTLTPVPTQVPTRPPTLAPTNAPTRSVTGTPRPAFAGFRLEFVEYSASYGMQFAFIIPGIQQNYELDVNGKPYTCNFYEKYKDRLFCTGPVIAPNTRVKLSFVTLDGSKREVYATSVVVPSQSTPTVDPTLAKEFNPDNCPVRGVNVRCETEYRVLGSGCCVVSTCVDACGYYYSIDTCPEGMEWEGICQGEPALTLQAP